MVAIELRAFLKRFEGYKEALFESQLVELNAIGKNNASNKTAMLQVREHATTDPEFYANNL